jgi:hypothetical protein
MSINVDTTRGVLSSREIDAKMAELVRELDILTGLRSRFRGTDFDWDSGAIFIRDDFLTEYIKNKAAGQLDLDSWPIKFIDWKKATAEYRKNHKGIVFKGDQYWVMSK